jgi:hypothetical protein
MEAQEVSALLEKLHPGLATPSEGCDLCDLKRWVGGGRSLVEIWEQCPRADWLIWLCGKMAGNDGWPTRLLIALAVCAVANAVQMDTPTSEESPRELMEISKKWEMGQATVQQLYDGVHTAITTHVRVLADTTIDGYATDAAAKARQTALKETARIAREVLFSAPIHTNGIAEVTDSNFCNAAHREERSADLRDQLKVLRGE